MSLANTHYGAQAIGQMMGNCHSVFFIGIGGISMSSLARMSARLGYRVGGSDRGESPMTRQLLAEGISVGYGHDGGRIRDYDAVVYTVAIGEDNPEYLAAREMGKVLLSRADYLGYLMMRFANRVGVSGMHGKSTCTTMCARIFSEAGDPTVLCGATFADAEEGSSCRLGDSRDVFLFEACEYMDSFLDFNPTLAVILNIGMDHVDYFYSMEQIRASFLQFANRTGEGGRVLYNGDDPESVCAMEGFAGEKFTFGMAEGADFRAANLSLERGISSFDFLRGEEVLGRIALPACGMHNIYNALAAASAAILCGVTPEMIVRALRTYRGPGRRMEYKGTCNGASVYDDYGHHPDEIRATLAGAKQMGFARVLCAYQPHTYSRTAGLLEEFSHAFEDADRVYTVDIYAAREENVYGVSSEQLAGLIGERALHCGSFQATADAIREEARPGDLVIVMGAGDVYRSGTKGKFEGSIYKNTVVKAL